jgi:hypothetical protein
MFKLPKSSEHPEVAQGCPVATLYDDGEDVGYVLQAIADRQ